MRSLRVSYAIGGAIYCILIGAYWSPDAGVRDSTAAEMSNCRGGQTCYEEYQHSCPTQDPFLDCESSTSCNPTTHVCSTSHGYDSWMTSYTDTRTVTPEGYEGYWEHEPEPCTVKYNCNPSCTLDGMVWRCFSDIGPADWEDFVTPREGSGDDDECPANTPP